MQEERNSNKITTPNLAHTHFLLPSFSLSPISGAARYLKKTQHCVYLSHLFQALVMILLLTLQPLSPYSKFFNLFPLATFTTQQQQFSPQLLLANLLVFKRLAEHYWLPDCSPACLLTCLPDGLLYLALLLCLRITEVGSKNKKNFHFHRAGFGGVSSWLV